MDPTNNGMGSIKTFVFLDIESTHLESLDRPKMMEICLVAVHRSELLETFRRHQTTTPLKEIQQPRVLTPRVVDTLSFCMDPGKAVSPVAFQMTGLDNLNLSESCKLRFGETDATMLQLFLARQQEPVCLLAHNGFKFDFPLIKTELDNINSDLSSNIVCGDTLCAFREMDGHKPTTPLIAGERKRIATASPNVLLDKGNDESIRPSVARSLFAPGYEFEKDDKSLAKMLSLTQSQGSHEEGTLHHSLNPSPPGGLSFCHLAHRYVNGRHRGGNYCTESRHAGHVSMDICQAETAEPLDANISSETSSYSPSLASLAVNRDECGNINNPSPLRTETPSNMSYSLGEIYRRTFKKYPTEAHQAMNDVMALIAVFIPRAKSLIHYFDLKAVPFEKVVPYYTSTPSRKRDRTLVSFKENQHGSGSARKAQSNDTPPPYRQWKKRRTMKILNGHEHN
ncbi:Three prime repair exonuclease 2 [Holothuria leucospilota]|uniref:Three prime repair exonuclease 2 n=1 Tax=Holothuria leucospilota TaxID=206669 RepID=A0A9Q1C5D9_HOLLE|nr:Three prime repair exonuclease 2 [Holothuria leucospilota]